MNSMARLTARTILGLGALFLTDADPSCSQEIDGDWRGAIDVMGQILPFVVHFAAIDGALGASIDIQGATGLALRNVSYDAPIVHFELQGGPGLAVWAGEHQGDSVSGTFTQAGIHGTFSMVHAETRMPEASSVEPVPYGVEEVTFANSTVTLAGTIMIPEGPGQRAARNDSGLRSTVNANVALCFISVAFWR